MIKLASGLVDAVGAALTIDGAHPGDPALKKILGMGSQTKAGVSIDHDSVMGLPAVMRGVNIVSNGVAKVPFYVFKNNADDAGRTWDKSHVSWTAVTRKPHPEFTSSVLRQTMTAWAMLWGNAVAYINRPNWPNRGPVELIPLLPDRTGAVRISQEMVRRAGLGDEAIGRLYYTSRIDGDDVSYPHDQCLHIRGLGPNPYWGYNVVDVLREALGGPMAAQEFGNRFYGQGANPAGWVTIPDGLEEEAEERFVESLRRASEGMGKAHRLAVLEEGAQFKQWTVDPEKAQFLEGKQFDVRLVAMAIGIKVHKLIDSANSSFKSLEQANQEHKEDDLIPWISRWREEMSDKLLTEEQLATDSHAIDVDDEYMEWAPFAERASGVVELYNNGLVDKEEGRRRVNFGPSGSQFAHRFRKPINIAFEDEQVVPTSQPRMDTDGDQSAAKWQATAEELRADHLDRIAKRLAKQAETKAAKKDGGKDFVAWVDGMKSESGPESIQADVDELYQSLQSKMAAVAEEASAETLAEQVASVAAEWRSKYEPETVLCTD